MKNFRSYQIAVKFYRLVETVRLKSHLKDQLRRASSSIVLNLAEVAEDLLKKTRGGFIILHLLACVKRKLFLI